MEPNHWPCPLVAEALRSLGSHREEGQTVGSEGDLPQSGADPDDLEGEEAGTAWMSLVVVWGEFAAVPYDWATVGAV